MSQEVKVIKFLEAGRVPNEFCIIRCLYHYETRRKITLRCIRQVACITVLGGGLDL